MILNLTLNDVCTYHHIRAEFIVSIQAYAPKAQGLRMERVQAFSHESDAIHILDRMSNMYALSIRELVTMVSNRFSRMPSSGSNFLAT